MSLNDYSRVSFNKNNLTKNMTDFEKLMLRFANDVTEYNKFMRWKNHIKITLKEIKEINLNQESCSKSK